MTPNQLSKAVEDLGLTQNSFAEFLDVEARTVRRWQAGDVAVPGNVSKFIRYMVAAGVTPAQVDAALKRGRR